jgi:hypothetical protein
MLFKKTAPIFVLSFALILSACGSNTSNNGNPKTDDCVGCAPPRQFSIDAGKSEFVVNVFGRKMGTPDAQAIDNFLQAKTSSGQINQLTVLATGIEGGASYCVAVHDQSTRTALLNELQQITTDLVETAYSIESMDNCN